MYHYTLWQEHKFLYEVDASWVSIIPDMCRHKKLITRMIVYYMVHSDGEMLQNQGIWSIKLRKQMESFSRTMIHDRVSSDVQYIWLPFLP